jgi:hypothetical protein
MGGPEVCNDLNRLPAILLLFQVIAQMELANLLETIEKFFLKMTILAVLKELF